MLLLQSIADEGSIDPISRKRRRRPSLPDSPPHAGTAQHPPKKQRPTPSHPDFPPRRFWEELSEIHLTKNALRALDRFGASNPPDPALKPSVQPTGRRLSNPTNGQQLVESFLHSSPTAPSRQIRRFASHGGPDLRDLRGYRFTGPIHKQRNTNHDHYHKDHRSV
ncbi:hypothetical protein CDD83_1771 [Cordyceps sp. RAO-2017]|nr:hypothetical protein CDD83_1771 [Cordyceps sp. RAO-2017]